MTATEENDEAKTPAEIAVGANADGDYILAPDEHAASLPPAAGALRRVLEQPTLLATIAGFGAFDKQAGQAQKRYKGICRRLLLVLAIALVVGLIATVIPWPEPYDGHMRWVAIVLVYAVMILAFWSLRVLDRENPYKVWHQQRATAELMRGQLFKNVIDAKQVGEQQPGEIDLLPLKLEYVRRYHMDVQNAYYIKRAAEHKRRILLADRWRKSGAAVIVVLLTCALIAITTPLLEPVPMLPQLQQVLGLLEWVEVSYMDAIVLFVGLCVMVGYGFALAMSSISNDLRNAGRYNAYAKRVATFYEELPDVRTLALDPANAAQVSAFVARFQDLLDTEHRDWRLMQETDDQPTPSKPWFSLSRLKSR
jgi:hypothetical protein